MLFDSIQHWCVLCVIISFQQSARTHIYFIFIQQNNSAINRLQFTCVRFSFTFIQQNSYIHTPQWNCRLICKCWCGRKDSPWGYIYVLGTYSKHLNHVQHHTHKWFDNNIIIISRYLCANPSTTATKEYIFRFAQK